MAKPQQADCHLFTTPVNNSMSTIALEDNPRLTLFISLNTLIPPIEDPLGAFVDKKATELFGAPKWGRFHEQRELSIAKISLVSENALLHLSTFIKRMQPLYNISIVLTSAWAKQPINERSPSSPFHPLQRMIVGFTPEETSKDEQIGSWLDGGKMRKNPNNYLIFDACPEFIHYKNKVVPINPQRLFSPEDIETAINVLDNPLPPPLVSFEKALQTSCAIS